MTHVAEDLYDVGATAYKKASDAAGVVAAESLRIASEKASDGLRLAKAHAPDGLRAASAKLSDGVDYSGRLMNEKFNEHWPTVSPYYKEHVLGNYETHVEPHLQTHVFPKLRQASTWSNEVGMPMALEAIEEGKKTYQSEVVPMLERQYQGAARLYANYCRSSLQEFLKASQELEVLKDNPPPAFLLESWETSCENPKDSLTALMQGTLVLFLVLFYRRIFGLAWSIVSFFVSLVVRFTPLRFFIRTSTTKAIESPPSSPSIPSPPSMKAASSESLMKSQDEYDVKESDDPIVVDANLY